MPGSVDPLIEASEILGTDADNVVKWKAMLAKMPPYLLDTDGALKEWAWPTLKENLMAPALSPHLYGAWPGDEIDPGRTPELAKAALLADRKRAPGNSSAHGLCHRALAGARLKDSYLVNFELKQLLEQGYVGPEPVDVAQPISSAISGRAGRLANNHDGDACLFASRVD